MLLTFTAEEPNARADIEGFGIFRGDIIIFGCSLYGRRQCPPAQNILKQAVFFTKGYQMPLV